MDVLPTEVVDAPGAVGAKPGRLAAASGFVRSLQPSKAEIARAQRRLHRKALLIVALAVASYAVLVFSSVGILLRLLSAAVLVVALVATATGIMHDGNHGAFSSSRRLNRLFGYTGDLLGASSWLWRFKHNTLHHASPNVMGTDTDIEQMPFARLAPEQPWRPWHRVQHLYLWFLYGFMALSWLLVSDLRTLVSGREGTHELPRRPSPFELGTIVAGKFLHVGWAIVVPLLFCPWWAVLTFYVVCSWAVGFSLALMFQLAHCVDVAEFCEEDGAHRGPLFAAHQLRSTVDIRIATPILGPFLRWWMGGLDNQVVHHLAPRLPHTIYPMVATRVDALCVSHGLDHRTHTSLFAALRSHARWLRLMGQPPLTVAP